MHDTIGKALYSVLSRSGRYRRSIYAPVPSPENIFLVEYPKSGITFLSVLLANYWDSKDITFFNVDRYVLDVHVSRATLAPRLDRTNVRLVKSHAERMKSYHYVIHLVRDPVDTLVSYFNYVRSYAPIIEEDTSFSRFIRSHRGIPRWLGHTRSWYYSPTRLRYVPITYANLIRNPAHFLGTIAALHGQELDAQALEKALRLSSKEAMIEQEDLWTNGGRRPSEGAVARFVGEKAFTRSNVRDTDIAFIQQHTGALYEEIAAAEEAMFHFSSVPHH